jgi:hypothetical protein
VAVRELSTLNLLRKYRQKQLNDDMLTSGTAP